MRYLLSLPLLLLSLDLSAASPPAESFDRPAPPRPRSPEASIVSMNPFPTWYFAVPRVRQ